MEAKLIFIGLGMVAYTLISKKLAAAQWLKKPRHISFWHAVFCMCSAFIVMTVLSTTFEDAHSAARCGLSVKQLIVWIAIILGSGLWGYRKSKKRSEEERALMQKEDLEWAETIYSATFMAAFFMFFFIQAFKIPSGSMRMTFVEGDHLFVNKFTYGFRIPLTEKKFFRANNVERGDIIVFRFPSNSPSELHCGGVQYGKDFIKRVIGLPGDKIEVRDGVLFVNNKPQQEESYAQYTDNARIPLLKRTENDAEFQQLWVTRNTGKKYGERVRDYFGPVTVPADSYFAMGDNRDHSCDSRFWGPVPDANVKGKAWFTYWPPSRMRGSR